MSFDCPSYCFESVFLSALSRFGLIKGPHCSDENRKQSLIDCFSEFRPAEDVENLLNGVHVDTEHHNRNLYDQGLELEYGLQKHLISSESCPNVSFLACLSYNFNLDIYVVCGLLPLRFLRIDGHNDEYDVLRFRFYRDLSPSRVVLGMIGMGIFHKIEQPSADSLIWTSLLSRSISVDNNNILFNDNQSDSEYEDDRALEDELVMNFDLQLETESGSMQTISRGNENIPRISMQEFVGRYLKYDSNGPNLHPESYNVSEKIDVELTSVEDLDDRPLTRLEQVVDIDGFFGVYDWKDYSVFKGNVKMCISPKRAGPREVNSFKKLLHDTHNSSEFEGAIYKVAICVTNFGIIDLNYACFFDRPNNSLTEDAINAVISRAFEHGKLAKCRDEATGELIHEDCTAFRFRENSDAYRSVEKGNSDLIYDRSRYECFTYHFGRAVVRGLSNVNIRLKYDLCLVQAVGMKFVMSSPTIHGVMHSVSEISNFFDLNRIHSNFDLCFSTVGHCSDADKAVTRISHLLF